jgi:Ca2+:H+ antiporter
MDSSPKFIHNYWDIIVGIIFGVIAFYAHSSGNSLYAAIFSAIAISAFSVTVSEIAEIVAEKVSEPYGSFILTFSAIAIEITLLFLIIQEAIHNPNAMETVKGSILSAIIVDINVLLGLAVFVGGLTFKEQSHNEDTSSSYTTILLVTSFVLLIPSILDFNTNSSHNLELTSILVSFLLFLFYIVIVIFQTKTHIHFFKPTARSRIFRYKRRIKEEDEDDESEYFFDNLSLRVNISVIVLLLIVVGLLAEIFASDGVKVFEYTGMSIGMAGIVIAIISVTPELFTAIKAAKNDQIQRVINIAMGASTVSILVTIPILMLLSGATGHILTLDFSFIQIGGLLLTIFLAWKTTTDGETDYLKGASHILFFLGYCIVVSLS